MTYPGTETSYPAEIDTYNDPTKWNPVPVHDGAGEHSNAYSAIIAIEETIGTTGAFNFGGVKEITSTGATVTITNPEGPVTNLETSGGLPVWFQSGAGDPISTNPTVPNTVGGLYFDTSGATGLWVATSALTSDWVQLGGPGQGVGLSTINSGAGLVSVAINAVGTGSAVLLLSGHGGSVVVSDDAITLQANNLDVELFVGTGNPNGVWAAFRAGNLYVDTTNTTPGIWMATTNDNAHWIQFGGILPTSSAGLVTGSFYTTAGIVHVA